MGAAAGAGMAAGWAMRLPEIISIVGSLDRVREILVARVRYRAAGSSVLPDGRSLFPEVARRAWAYMPLHLVASCVTMGAIATSAALSRGRSRFPPAARAFVACLIAEGLYFVLMRQHVASHRHTIVHLTFSAALGGAIGLRLLGRGLARLVPARLAMAAVPGATAASLLLLPIEAIPNLQLPDRALRWERLRAAVAEAVEAAPSDAAFLISAAGLKNEWAIREALARLGRPFASSSHERVATGARDVFDVPVRTARPLYVFASSNEREPAHSRLLKEGVLVALHEEFSLFAYRNYDPPAVPRPLPESDVARGYRLSPTDAQLAERKARPPAGPIRRGFWIAAPPRAIGGETRYALPIGGAFERGGRVTARMTYRKLPGKRQPVLMLGLAAAAGGAAPSAVPTPAREVAPGESRRVEIDVPATAGDVCLVATVRLRPGESDFDTPAIELREFTVARPHVPDAAATR
jgi:hypothetical protein